MYTLQHKDPSQSPWLEDIYNKYIGYKSDGFFVEIGVGRCIGCPSNTASLADLGWRGIYIEPNPNYCIECEERHSNNDVTVLNFAAGDTHRTVTLTTGDTLRKEVKDNFDRLNYVYFHHFEPMEVTEAPVNELLTNSLCPPKFDLLSVDVEGYEKIVFDELDLSLFTPKVIVAESRAFDLRFDEIFREESKHFEKRIESQGYSLIYRDELNVCFVKDPTSQLDSEDITL